MIMTEKEYSQTLKYLREKKVDEQWSTPFRNLVIQGRDLSRLSEQQLRHLRDALPSGRSQHVFSPIVHGVRQKIKKTLLHGPRPHLDPNHWPKVFRKINNNSQQGLQDFSGGQLGVLHDKAMSIPLKGTFKWTQRQFGELIIMGSWTDISTAVGKAAGLEFKLDFGDIYAGDVNVQFDQMYTDEKIPEDDMCLYVTYIPGAAFAPSDDEGRVVADPRGDIVKVAGSKVAAVAGTATNLLDAIASLSCINDLTGITIDMAEKFGVTLKSDHSKQGKYTFVIGHYPVGSKYKFHETKKKAIDGGEFLKICKDLADV